MEELSTMMKREDLNDRIWKLVQGWGDKRILNHFMTNVPIHMAEEIVEELEKLPKDELTPREAFTEGHRRADLQKRLQTTVEELELDRDALVKEVAIECQIQALEEFTAKLENCGGEKCKTWRVKLVSISLGFHPDAKSKMVIYGYFKCDIDKEELNACYKAWQRKKDFDFEVNLPEDVKWKLNTELREVPDKVAENAGWTRYLLGEPV